MKRLSRGVKKSGTLDATSLWARARLAFAKQLSEWLEIRKMQLEDIIFLDEHHEKCHLGLVSDIETLIARTPDGKIAPESEGGYFQLASRPHRSSLRRRPELFSVLP